jgi:predicted transposase/invertase (TIGR01784 family)
MPFDNACKYLSETYPTEFASWLLGKVPTSVQVLKTELSIEPIRADYVTFLRTGERILHLEFEVDVEGEPPLPLRMLDYWVRLYRRYRVPVTQALILLKESSTSNRLKDTFRLENTRHKYQIIRMWEQEPDIFLQNKALLPLAALCRSAAPEQLLNQVAEEVGKIETAAERSQISGCTQLLAGLRFNKSLIQRLFREAVMRESVIYQDILQEGLQQGVQQGIKSSILDALEVRFGTVPSEVAERLNFLTTEQLQQLLRQSVTSRSLEEFINQLPSGN